MDPDGGGSCCTESRWFTAIVCFFALAAAGALVVAFWPWVLLVFLIWLALFVVIRGILEGWL